MTSTDFFPFFLGRNELSHLFGLGVYMYTQEEGWKDERKEERKSASMLSYPPPGPGEEWEKRAFYIHNEKRSGGQDSYRLFLP